MAGEVVTIAKRACVLRLARLAADGTTPAGANNSVVIGGLIEGKVNPVYAETPDTFDFDVCDNVLESEPPVGILRYADMDLACASFDPERMELTNAVTRLTVSTNTRGWVAPAIGPVSSTGISIEMWMSNYVGGLVSATLPYLYGWMPKFAQMRLTERTFTRQRMPEKVIGRCFENAGWGNGPDNLTVVTPTNRIFGFLQTATAPPAIATGYVAVPTQV